MNILIVTFGIFILHKPMYQDLILAGFKTIGFTEPWLLVTIIGAIIVLPVCVLLILVINKFLPQILGNK